MSKAVTAVFSDSNSAENAARQIKEEGLRTEDISVVAKHGNNGDGNYDARGDGLKDNGAKDNGVRDNISDGVLTGGVIGSLAGLLIGAGTLMVPGLGLWRQPVRSLGFAGSRWRCCGRPDRSWNTLRRAKYESDIKSGKILLR